jgi:hypothetical protein
MRGSHRSIAAAPNHRVMTLVLAIVASCAGVREDQPGAGGGWNGGIRPHPTSTDARPQRCDDSGDCKCMSIGSLGKVAHYGSNNNDTTDAFQTYLNTKSNARMTLLTNRVTLTPDLLASYDVLILQALEDSEYIGFWSYSQAEINTLAEWVRAGNGLIVLTGYGSVADEVNPDNQLLSFAGITYGKTDTFTACPDNYCYCTDSSIPFAGWQSRSFICANMIASNGQPGEVGVFHGRSITCKDTAEGPCQIVATDPQGGIVGVGKTIGKGRVFVWGDEWVTYTSQWGGTNSHGADCNGHTASEIYDVPQFWYNVIRWVLPDASCFNIADPIVVP